VTTPASAALATGWPITATGPIVRDPDTHTAALIADSSAGCKDVAMTRAAVVCVVCHYPRVDGSLSDNGEFFVCSGCQADAKQFIQIQDDIWPSDTETTISNNASDDSADP